MDPNRRSDEHDSGVSRSSTEKPIPAEWQFSLRGLLLTVTTVSICLAVGTHLAGVVFVIFAVVVIEVSTLLAGEWLIRPANQQVLAFVTAGSWMVFGSGLAIIAYKIASHLVALGAPEEYWAAVVFLALFALFCYGFSWHRWRQLTSHRRTNL